MQCLRDRYQVDRGILQTTAVGWRNAKLDIRDRLCRLDLSLAGVRCGVLISRSELIELLGRVLPPYCFPTTSQEAVLRSLTPSARQELAERRARILAERQRLMTALPTVPGILRVWPSTANFILVESRDAPALVAMARAAGILVRDFSGYPLLPGCVRITVGSPDENDKLLKALGT